MNVNKISCMQAIARPMDILKATGLWPATKVDAVVILKFFCNILYDIVMVSVVLCNIIIAVKTRNVKFFNWMTCVLFPLTNYFGKTIPLWLNKKNFLSILNDLNSSAFNTHTNQQNQYIYTIDKISRLILWYFASVMAIFLVVVSILPFFSTMPLMIPAPFNTGNYDVIYKIAHLFATSYVALTSASIDVFYMALIAVCRAQLNILQERLMNISEDAQTIYVNDLGNYDAIIENILKECIILHETINRFVDKLSVMLSFPLFIQYGYGCFIICNTILQLTILGEKSSTTIIGLCGYSGIVFAQMSAYHWLGNEIICLSDKITESCSLAKWYNLNVKCQKYLIILMERAKRQLTISLYGLVFVSLASLAVVVRWSYSVFALIKARYS